MTHGEVTQKNNQAFEQKHPNGLGGRNYIFGARRIFCPEKTRKTSREFAKPHQNIGPRAAGKIIRSAKIFPTAESRRSSSAASTYQASHRVAHGRESAGAAVCRRKANDSGRFPHCCTAHWDVCCEIRGFPGAFDGADQKMRRALHGRTHRKTKATLHALSSEFSIEMINPNSVLRGSCTHTYAAIKSLVLGDDAVGRK